MCLNGVAETNLPIFIPHLVQVLDRKPQSKAEHKTYDVVSEGAVVFMGATAAHLAQDDPKVGRFFFKKGFLIFDDKKMMMASL